MYYVRRGDDYLARVISEEDDLSASDRMCGQAYRTEIEAHQSIIDEYVQARELINKQIRIARRNVRLCRK